VDILQRRCIEKKKKRKTKLKIWQIPCANERVIYKIRLGEWTIAIERQERKNSALFSCHSVREHSFCQKHKAIKQRNTPLVMLFITNVTRQGYYITVLL